MRYFSFLCLMFLFVSIFLSGCNKNENLPICVIFKPKTNSKVISGRNIKIYVSANSLNDNIEDVTFFVDGIKTETIYVQANLCVFNWQTDNYEYGMHIVKAEAVDGVGLSSEDEINIEIVKYVPITSVTDYRDGNIYKVVEIGEQVWMSENLRREHEFSRYVNNDSCNTVEYGYLYKTNIGAGGDVCPDEWHIPYPEEWNELIEYLGGESVAGGKLKEAGTQRWKFPNTEATNLSGFSARPAGSLRIDSNITGNTWYYLPKDFGSQAIFLTANYGEYYYLDFDAGDVKKLNYHPMGEFFSLRCIRDY